MAKAAADSKSSSMHLQDKDEVQKVFSRFDTNGDGKISADEVRGVLTALGSDTTREEVARLMSEVDTDKDGFISLAAFYDDGHGSADKELHDAFELYDQDHDGKISTVELHQILTRLGEHCSVEDCAGMIKSVDSDGDGYVDIDEFKKMMTNNTKISS